MVASDVLPFQLGLGPALAVGGAISLLGTLLVMPRILRKLRGAGITGRDINKPNRPEIPEMGGIGVFLGFNAGVFVLLAITRISPEVEMLTLVALITTAGAAMTGIIDDLVELRQRFKAFIPFVFAAPLALYAADQTITFPGLGTVDFGLLYPLVLVPVGIACASNGFNMLEGYNGLGAGVGLVSTVALGAMAVLTGRPEALLLLVPLGGALVAFLFFNRYPAKVFPGDTLTLFVGAVLASAAIVAKLEFWGALLFLPHILEFALKARGHFEAENFAKKVEARPGAPALLAYEGRTESLTHILLKRRSMTEPAVSASFWAIQGLLSVLVIGTFLLARGA